MQLSSEDQLSWLARSNVKANIFPTDDFIPLHYIQYSNTHSEDGDCIAFLFHGSLQTCHTFDDFIPIFLQQTKQIRKIYSVDLRGHGDSGHAKHYSLDYFSRDIFCFISHFLSQQQQPCKLFLVGASLGGIILLHLLYKLQLFSQEIIKGLVIIDITPTIVKEGISKLHSQVNQLKPEAYPLETYLEWAQKVNPNRSVENLKHRLLHNLKPIFSHDALQPLYTWKYDLQFKHWVQQEMNSNYLWQVLSSRSIKTLLVRGALSTITDETVMQQMQQSMLQSTVVVIENAGHSVQGDQPLQLSQQIGNIFFI